MSVPRWIWSLNIGRRHLSEDQIAAAEVAIHALEEAAAARQRQMEGRKRGGKTGGRGRPKADSSGTKSPQGCSEVEPGAPAATPSPQEAEAAKPESAGRVREKIAKKAGVSQHKIRQALKIQKADPNLLKEVVNGKTPLRQATKKAKAKSNVKAKAKPKTKPSKAKQPAFAMERELKRIIRAVDTVLDNCDDESRGAFLTELVKTLEAMK
jgi:hypothetical protein